MAGVTDRPFRQLCRQFGAALAPAEMLSADQRLWSSSKSQRRMDHDGEPEPRVVQLVGADPQELASAARVNVELGAQIVDINMGCPAKKVCSRDAGSALLADEGLIERILVRGGALGLGARDAQDPHRHRSRRAATRRVWQHSRRLAALRR